MWAHVYTDGSCNAAVRNGRTGIHIHLRSGKTFPGRKLHVRCQATTEPNILHALQEAARLLSTDTPPLSHIVFLTDCKSAVQCLQSSREQLEIDTQRPLCDQSQDSKAVVPRIPVHCGLAGNEEADRLAKYGSEQERPNLKISFGEVKALIKQLFLSEVDASREPTI